MAFKGLKAVGVVSETIDMPFGEKDEDDATESDPSSHKKVTNHGKFY